MNCLCCLSPTEPLVLLWMRKPRSEGLNDVLEASQLIIAKFSTQFLRSTNFSITNLKHNQCWGSDIYFPRELEYFPHTCTGDASVNASATVNNLPLSSYFKLGPVNFTNIAERWSPKGQEQFARKQLWQQSIDKRARGRRRHQIFMVKLCSHV